MTTTNYPRLFQPTSGAPNTSCPLQTSLLSRLSDTLRDGLHTTTKEFIALCEYNINPGLSTYVQGMSGSELQAASAAVTVGIKRWQACRSSSSGPNNDQASRPSKTNRSSTAAKMATIRDQHRCVISLYADPLEVAHLVPLSCFNNSNDFHRTQPAFLSLLHIFAGEETKQRVLDYLGLENTSGSIESKPGGATHLKINRMENLMTLTRDLHRWWDTGKIILEPVGDPLSIFATGGANVLLTHYDVVFSFVPSHRPPSQKTGWDPSTLIQLAPLSSLQFNENEDPLLQEICIMRRTTIVPPLPSAPGTEAKEPTREWKQLRTGTVIRLVTNDPVKYPLPHPDLLSLHAALSRVMRCAAAAGPEMLDLEEDDELSDGSVDAQEDDYSIQEEPQIPDRKPHENRVWGFLNSLPSPTSYSPLDSPPWVLSALEDSGSNCVRQEKIENGKNRRHMEVGG
ncbi:hypothetical protein L211DRAFT_888700 [Terfezia boudieri ATCC MYA-4762]|uniref:HNH nuclease domain-containing protein n=1 Tax=Terfezia boudieri ATCC MYA-4762 TaxID=1051890 RepID=A0A3N4LFW2_9PEZI|nr:hypothetical protein L211DRAFT_888700 [Terfezia boudieri ATCC MYA-4762]